MSFEDAAASASLCLHVWVRPVPGLEVASESLQVHGREVGSDAFPEPPLSLRGAGTSRLAELVNKMFSSDPPEGNM